MRYLTDKINSAEMGTTMTTALIALGVLVALAVIIYQNLGWRHLNAFRTALRETAGTRTRDLNDGQPSAHSARIVTLLDYRATLNRANEHPRITDRQKARNTRTMRQIDQQVARLKDATTRAIGNQMASEYENAASVL